MAQGITEKNDFLVVLTAPTPVLAAETIEINSDDESKKSTSAPAFAGLYSSNQLLDLSQ